MLNNVAPRCRASLDSGNAWQYQPLNNDGIRHRREPIGRTATRTEERTNRETLERRRYAPQSINGRIPRSHQWLPRSRLKQNQDIVDWRSRQGRMRGTCKNPVKVYEIAIRTCVRRRRSVLRVHDSCSPRIRPGARDRRPSSDSSVGWGTSDVRAKGHGRRGVVACARGA